MRELTGGEWFSAPVRRGPDILPKMKVLERIQVPSYSEFREEWIGWGARSSRCDSVLCQPTGGYDLRKVAMSAG